MDHDDFYEQLARNHPELMKISNFHSVEVGQGWYALVDALFATIESDVNHAKYRLKAATEHPRDDGGTYLEACTKELNDALEKLPVIVQIKEKFGGFRFYTHNGTEYDKVIRYAEIMAARTCDVCGRVGKIDAVRGVWASRCAQHKIPDMDDEYVHDGSVAPKIATEE